MNTKQQDAWKDLVQQCKTQRARRFYSSINVASKVRSDAIVAADELVELVTPELAELLEALAIAGDLTAHPSTANLARTLAVKVREVLDDSQA